MKQTNKQKPGSHHLKQVTTVNILWRSEVAQSCPTLCNLPGFSIHGILQARILEWVTISFSKECSNYHTIALISQASKVMLKIIQARLQQYMNHEIPDVQAGFKKGRGTRYQIANICWIIEKAREFQENIYFWFIDYAKAFDCVENSERDGNTRPPDLPPDKSVCRSRNNS